MTAGHNFGLAVSDEQTRNLHLSCSSTHFLNPRHHHHHGNYSSHYKQQPYQETVTNVNIKNTSSSSSSSLSSQAQTETQTKDHSIFHINYVFNDNYNHTTESNSSHNNKNKPPPRHHYIYKEPLVYVKSTVLQPDEASTSHDNSSNNYSNNNNTSKEREILMSFNINDVYSGDIFEYLGTAQYLLLSLCCYISMFSCISHINDIISIILYTHL